MKRRIYIFDLDNTVIDSGHRTPYFPNGDLNLVEYLKNCTRENVMKDGLFPLANFMRRKIRERRDTVVICTAREMRFADWTYITKHGLRPDICLSRNHIDKDHFFMSDGPYKVRHLSCFTSGEFADFPKIMFDDNLAVVAAVSQMPLFTVLPVRWSSIS